MPALERNPTGCDCRCVFASRGGAEVFAEESRFAGWEFRLVDEEILAGTLTEAGGNPR